MNQDYESTREINLKEAMIYIVKNWRKILIVMISTTVLIGGYFAWKYKSTSEESRQEAMDQYTYEYNAYFAQKDTLNDQIHNMTETKDRIEEYNKKSIKMMIDPLNLCVGTAQFYVSTNYQIMPGMTYQNTDKSVMILNAYSNYVNSGSMYQDILKCINYDIELRYLKEIITVTTDLDSHMIEITVNQKDEDSCSELLNAIVQLLEEKQSVFTASIGEHDLTKVDHAIYYTVDFELEQFQKDSIQSVADLTTEIQESSKLLTTLKKQPIPKYDYDTTVVIKSIVKNIIIALFISMILGMIYYGIRFITTNKIMYVEDFKQMSNLTILGYYYQEYKGNIDRWILKKFGVKTDNLDIEEKTKLIYEMIQMSYHHSTKEKGQVLLVTSIKTNYTEQVIGALLKYSLSQSLRLEDGKNLITDINAMKKLEQCNQVIILEEMGASKRSDIVEEFELVNRLGKEVLGIVFVNA